MTSVNRRWLVAGFVLALGATPALGQSNKSAATATERTTSTPVPTAVTGDEFRIGPEDVIDISVWQNAELTKLAVPVRPDGKISVVLLNDIQAAGLTPMQLRTVLVKGYDPYLHNLADSQVSVLVREVHSIKVSVIGKVHTSGRFELKSQASVLEALAMAGGFSEADMANKSQIKIIRRDGDGFTTLSFNYEKVADGDPRGVFKLQNGDVVVVK